MYLTADITEFDDSLGALNAGDEGKSTGMRNLEEVSANQ